MTSEELAATAAVCSCFGDHYDMFKVALAFCEDEQGHPCPRLRECVQAAERRGTPVEVKNATL